MLPGMDGSSDSTPPLAERRTHNPVAQGNTGAQPKQKRPKVPVLLWIAGAMVVADIFGCAWAVLQCGASIGDAIAAGSAIVTAVATGVVALYTGRLNEATELLAAVSADTLQRMDREFNATHRPSLRLRRIVFARQDSDAEKTADHVKIVLANVGDSIANITECRMTFLHCWSGRLNTAQIEARLDQNRIDDLLPPFVNAGHRIAAFIPLKNFQRNMFSDPLLDRGRTVLYCVGFVTYEDALHSTPRTTGFIRALDPKSRRFRRVKNRDYEYSD